MELINKISMNKIPFILLLLCLFTNCSKDSNGENNGTTYKYYYATDEAAITASQIGAGSGILDPKGITVANNKLYICNGDVLEIFDATTLKYLKTITNYTKGTTTITLTKLSSVCVDNGRLYVGSVDSRLFVFDEITNAGISTVGNGQWWNTFVHVFGVVVNPFNMLPIVPAFGTLQRVFNKFNSSINNISILHKLQYYGKTLMQGQLFKI